MSSLKPTVHCTCRFGDKCKYYHDVEGLGFANAAGEEGQEEQEAPKVAPKAKVKAKAKAKKAPLGC